jgi:hypothetical protein
MRVLYARPVPRLSPNRYPRRYPLIHSVQVQGEEVQTDISSRKTDVIITGQHADLPVSKKKLSKLANVLNLLF